MPQTLQLLGQVPVVEDEADEVLDDAQALSRPIRRRVDHPQHVDLVDGGRRAGRLRRQRARIITRRRGRGRLLERPIASSSGGSRLSSEARSGRCP